MLAKNFQQRLGSQLNEKQSARLERGLEHYMSEVFEANPGVQVQFLNKEVLSATASDFNDYIQRKDLAAVATPQMFQEASQRFDTVQQERQRSLEGPRPTVPEYVQSITIKEDDSVSALSLFEEAKKRRNMEMNEQAETQIAARTKNASQPLYLELPERPDPRSIYDKPLDLVIAGQIKEPSGRADINMTTAVAGPTMASRGTLPQDMIIKQQDIQTYKETEYNLSVYSADRKWEVDTNHGENRFNFSVNLYSGNPTNGLSIMPKGASRLRNIVRIEFVKAVIPIEVTDVLVRKISNFKAPDLLTSIALSQAVATTTINVNANRITAPEAVANAVNVIRLYQNINGVSYNYDTSYVKNIFAYPFITLNVAELDTNNYGTSNSMDNAFGILQYDSNWTDSTDSLGFTSLIPKHMKCQRIYSPTPLASLNKLTIRLQQPNGSLVNSTKDTIDISGIFMSRKPSMQTYFGTHPPGLYNVDISGTGYTDITNVGEYIWLDCKQYFSQYQIAVGDRIQVRNLVSSDTSSAMADLLNYVQRSEGHSVVGMAYLNPQNQAQENTVGDMLGQAAGTYMSSSTFQYNLVDGSNPFGYSRFIIIRGQYNDPTTGSMSVLPFGGQTDNTTLTNVTGTITGGKFINLSRQTQFIFRVITREYDSSSLVRPDNL